MRLWRDARATFKKTRLWRDARTTFKKIRTLSCRRGLNKLLLFFPQPGELEGIGK